MLEKHQQEKHSLLKGTEEALVKSKPSSHLLNERFKLKQMIKARDYVKAKELKEQITEREKLEEEEFKIRTQQGKDKQLENLEMRQGTELAALRLKLENQISQKM